MKSINERLSILEKRIGISEGKIDWEKKLQKIKDIDLRKARFASKSDSNYRYLNSLGYTSFATNRDGFLSRDSFPIQVGSSFGIAGNKLEDPRSGKIFHRAFSICTTWEDDWEFFIRMETSNGTKKTLVRFPELEPEDWKFVWKTIADYVRKVDRRYNYID